MWFRLFCFASSFALVGILPASSWAQECSSDADCAAGQICVYEPCAGMPCDPDDSTCEPVDCPTAGVCVEDDSRFMEECESDADCEGGWVCEVVGASACAGVACPDGEECSDPPPCEPDEILACVPPPPEPCASDADCGEGLVCVTYEYTACDPVPAIDCAPDQECPLPEPSCEDVTESYCVPPYFAPCSEDADCGDGFACVEGEICECSGGGAVGGSGGGSSSDPPDAGDDASSGTTEVPDCSCEPSGELYCELEEMPCNADADCPEGFVCEEMGMATSTCVTDAETGETQCDEESVESEAYCVPADWDRWVGGGTSAEASREAFDDTVGESLGADDAQASGRASDFDFPDVGGSSDEGGCQVAPVGTGLLGLLLAMGAGALIRRRDAKNS